MLYQSIQWNKSDMDKKNQDILSVQKCSLSLGENNYPEFEFYGALQRHQHNIHLGNTLTLRVSIIMSYNTTLTLLIAATRTPSLSIIMSYNATLMGLSHLDVLATVFPTYEKLIEFY